MKSSMCENCIKYKTIYCSNSDECLARENKPFYEDKYTILTRKEVLEEMLIDLHQENQQLKLINEEYERLNKENGRGFKITSVKQYNMDELVRCKDNWNELRKYIKEEIILDFYNNKLPFEIIVENVLNKMKELERGVSDEIK